MINICDPSDTNKMKRFLSLGLVPVISTIFIGCSLHVEPLRKYAPLPYAPCSIKFISKDDALKTKKTLGLDEAIAICMTNNHALRIAREEINMAEGQLRQAKLLNNPEIELNINSSSASDAVLNIAGSLTQPIPLFWPKRQVAIAVAEASVERAKAEILRFEWELRVGVKRTYLQTLLLQNEKTLFEQSLEISRSLSASTARLKIGGETSRISELLVQSELIEAKARLIEIESELAKKRSELAIIIGGTTLPLLADGTLEFPESLDFDPLKLSRTFAAGNPEIYLRDAEIRLMTLEQTAASNAWWPDSKIGVSGEREAGGDRLLGGLFSIELPIFNRNQGEIQSRTAALSKAQIEREQTIFVGQHALDRLIIVLRQTRQLISLYQDQGLSGVEENLKLVQRAIAAGESTPFELIAARRQSIAMKLAYLRARFAALEILLDLEAVLGTPVFDFKIERVTTQEK
ncbi:MAG: TolC family protein [Desulfosalsimonadaceae bacterium]|nr:TolC family protein [Desulfosalsimonadaceae bacterium]